MKTVRAVAILVAFCVVLPFAARAFAAEGDKVVVPYTLEGISDTALRDAVKDHSPNYDSLSRGSQIFTYVDVYKFKNDGRIPDLVPEDRSQLEGMANNPAEVHSLEVPAIRASTYDDVGLNNIMSSPDWFDNPKLDSDAVMAKTINYVQ